MPSEGSSFGINSKMDSLLRNYADSDQEETQDLESKREQTASPTGSSSSSSRASSKKPSSNHRKQSADDEDYHEDVKDNTPSKGSGKEGKHQYKSHKEPKEKVSSSSTDEEHASSHSDTSSGSDSKSRSRSSSPVRRNASARNGANERKCSGKPTPGGNNSSNGRKSQSPAGHYRRTPASGGGNRKSPMKAPAQYDKRKSPQSNHVRRQDRSNSRERVRKDRVKARDLERERNRERNRERERVRERERDRERDRDRDRNRERDREQDRERHRERDRNRDRVRDRNDRGRGVRNDCREQRRGCNYNSKGTHAGDSRRDTPAGYDRKDKRSSEYDKDRRRNRRSNSREPRNRKRYSPDERTSSKPRESRSRSRSQSASKSPPLSNVNQAPVSLVPLAGLGLLPLPSRFSTEPPPQTKPMSLLPTPSLPQSLLGVAPVGTATTGIPSLMSIPTKPPMSSLIPPAVAAKLNLTNELKLQMGLPLVPPPQDATVAGVLLSRSALLRNNAKAAQLEKMGIDVLQQSQKAVDSVPLPSYYNPGAVNPVRYADQVQKRKLLWSHKTTESKEVSSNISKWEQAKFAQDTDGRVASKFLRLMGVKDAQQKAGEESMGSLSPMVATASSLPAASTSGTVEVGGHYSATSGSSSGKLTGDSIKKQEELFSTMEQQYEVARQVTHTMRGVGLGFSSQARQF